MPNKIKMYLPLALLLFCAGALSAQSWADTLDSYAREKFLPAKSYHWRWTHAALLNTMVKQYYLCPAEQKPVYLAYVKKAMDKTYGIANGKTPNAVASALGLAFLYKETHDEKYKAKAEKVFADYQHIRRTKDGGVSHLMLFTELWDDTIFMIGQFLLAMYQATNDEKYLDEFMKQLRLHREKLQNPEVGLWVHGWDSDNKIHCTFCSQMHWADKESRKSAEYWGRGNGWIVVTLSDALDIIPKTSPYWQEAAGCLQQMLQPLPALQDKTTGHWYQLPVRNTDPDNWKESSCTAMFAYGLNAALRQGLLHGDEYEQSIALAYRGLRTYSMEPVKGKYLTLTNVCTGTCIGNKQYYFKRHRKSGSPYGIGMAIQFARRYELDRRRKM
jgi:unsaturated rhamnogalacturonyl hydrolase